MNITARSSFPFLSMSPNRKEYKFSGQYTGDLDRKTAGAMLGKALEKAGSTCTFHHLGEGGKAEGSSSGANFKSVTVEAVTRMVAEVHQMGVSIHRNSFEDSGPLQGWGHVQGTLSNDSVELPEDFTDAADILCALAQDMRDSLHAIGVEFVAVEGRKGMLEITFRSRNVPAVDEELAETKAKVVQQLMCALSRQRIAVDGSEVEAQAVRVPFERK